MPALSRRALAGALAALLAGCATLPPGAPADHTAPAVAARLGAAPEADDGFVDALRARPLSPADATRIALARNPAIARQHAELGLARADLLQTAKIANPTLSLSFLDVVGGPGSTISRAVEQPLADLLTRPARLRLGEADYSAARDAAAAAIVDLALQVESQWFTAVGARQRADIEALRAELADAAAELAQRYADAGNLEPAELATLRAEAAATALAAQDAARAARRERRALQSLLGLRADEAFELPTRLPRLAADATLPDDLAILAASQRLDLAAAATRLQRQQRALELARGWRLLGEVDLGYEREREPDGGLERGPEIALAIPIFDQGQAGIARAEAALAQAEADLATARAAVAQEVDDAREDLAARRAAADTLLDQLLPARAAQVARLTEANNWMLVSPFELIAARDAQFEAWATHVATVQGWWQARIALRRAVGGALPALAVPMPGPMLLPPDGLAADPADGPAKDANDKEAAPAGAHQHHDHGDTP
jgi:cobalt-zinc-cadmium efflux system outer membrane protein